MSHEKNPLTFHYTGCLIGILIMVYYNPHITGYYNPLYTLNNWWLFSLLIWHLLNHRPRRTPKHSKMWKGGVEAHSYLEYLGGGEIEVRKNIPSR